MNLKYLLLLGCGMALSSCKNKETKPIALQEDLKAKQMMQGIWLNEENMNVAFRVKGDTIFYPDSITQPVYFQIFKDTIVLHGAREIKYPIIRQTRNLLKFRNLNGEEVMLTLSEDAEDETFFVAKHPIALNQNQLIKRDTVISYNGDRYHAYVQVNPTTYKVLKTAYNDEGVAVDNFYYDNIVKLHIYQGPRNIFSSDFRKHRFEKQVPADILSQSVLSDLTLKQVDAKGFHYVASLVIPDSMSSFEVELVIDFKGHLSIVSN